MKIQIDIETLDEFMMILGVRDDLRDRINELEREPLKFSLRNLSWDVAEQMGTLTPDQKKRLKAVIENGGGPPEPAAAYDEEP
jgi:hypothetical protein